MSEIKLDEIKRKWNSIDESVRRHYKTGEEFYSYTVTQDMTKDVFELIAEVERLRNEISFIANVDMVKNAHDIEHVAVSVKSWALDTLEGVKRRK